MRAQPLVQLAHLVAQKSPNLTAIDEEQLDGTLGQYWATSKCRIQNWQDELARLENNIRHGDSDQHPEFWFQAAPILSEIMFANILTSVATATVLSVPESGEELAPIVMGVLESERDARTRLEIMLELACDRNLRQRKHIPELTELATTCKQSASWTDLMLGLLIESSSAVRCGFIHDRVRQNQANCAALRTSGKLPQFHRRISADIEQFFDKYPIKPSPIGHLNAKIARSLELAFGMKPAVRPNRLVAIR